MVADVDWCGAWAWSQALRLRRVGNVENGVAAPLPVLRGEAEHSSDVGWMFKGETSSSAASVSPWLTMARGMAEDDARSIVRVTSSPLHRLSHPHSLWPFLTSIFFKHTSLSLSLSTLLTIQVLANQAACDTLSRL